MKSFLDNIQNNDALYQQMQSILSTNFVTKGAVLQKKGDRFSKIYLVTKGCLRSYTIDDKGKEHIYMFAPEGWIISDIESQVTNHPSQLYIDAVEDTEFECLSRNNQSELVLYNAMIENVGTDRLMKRLSVLQRRVILLMSASALDRYNDFLDTYPNIVQRVPQKMIASYLGITPEALSKIRRQIAKGNK
jgi:CRP-like cAMP-binding protein